MTKTCFISSLSIHSKRWIEAIAQRNYETFLISDSKTWIAPTPKSTKIFTLPRVNKQTFAKCFLPNSVSIVRILKKIKPDIVNLHVQHHYSLAIIFSHHPYVLTSWGLEVLALPNADFPTKNLAKMTATLARKIVVDAKCLKEIWTGMGIPKNKVEVIPFGVDTNVFRPCKNKSSIRKELDIKQSDTVVISTRPFFSNHYNVECLIKSIPLVVKHHKDVKFILKGKGPLEVHLQNLVKQLKIEKCVRFVGLTSHKEVANYLAASDIYVSTSFIDSTSVSLLEAMACGLAPVTTDIAGNHEWIENGKNGLLYAPKNHISLANKISQLAENETERKLYGERSLEIAHQKANWKKCVEKFERVCETLL